MSILKSTTYEDMVADIRDVIVDKSGLSELSVANALSVRGTDLQKIIDNAQASSRQKYTSYNLNDTFMVFEPVENDSEKYFILHEDDNSTSVIRDYDYNLKIYGNHSHEVSHKLAAIFRDETVLLNLHDKGLYIKNITKPKANNEFINNTLWTRIDMTINMTIRLNYDGIDTSGTFAETPTEENIGYFRVKKI